MGSRLPRASEAQSGSGHSLHTPPRTVPLCSAVAEVSLPPPVGFVSWRDKKSGSWYIETLDGVLEQWARSEDLQSLLLRVSTSS